MITALIAVSLFAAIADSPCPSEDSADFGDWLAEQGDYYRAIGEYQRALYREPSEATSDLLWLRIARAYALGDQADKAAEISGRIARGSSHEDLRAEATLVLAYARDKAGDHDVAVSLLQRLYEDDSSEAFTTRARLAAALSLLHSGEHDAEAVLALKPLVDNPEATAAVSLSRAAESLQRLHHKSPAVAGLLSGVVPGLGQLYLGEHGAALAAFSVNALFVWATIDAFRSQQYGLGAAAAAVESLWYGGAIFGAVAGAHRYNRDARAIVLEEAERGLRPELDLFPLPRRVLIRATGRF